jgi:hypothetical protein
VFQIGVAPRRIDILTSIDGVTFDEAWATRVPCTLAGTDAAVLGFDALIRNKRATGRARDRVDVRILLRAGRGNAAEAAGGTSARGPRAARGVPRRRR